MAGKEQLPETAVATAAEQPKVFQDRNGFLWTENTDPKSPLWRSFTRKGSNSGYALETVRRNFGPLYRVVNCPECGRKVAERMDDRLRQHRRPSPGNGNRKWCLKGGQKWE